MSVPTGFQTVDDQGRVVLPPTSVASVPKPPATPAAELGDDDSFPDDILLPGEQLLPLSDRDRDLLLDLLENPPEPNEALRKLLAPLRSKYESGRD